MKHSIYIDEATPWADLAKMDIPKFLNDRPVVPVFHHADISIDYPVASADLHYELKEFELEKIMYEEPELHENHVHRQMQIWNMIEGKAMRGIATLRFNDIPVFNVERKSYPTKRDHFYPEIVIEYQIPEVLMYKSFFVLHDFKEAINKSKEYAMQQVQKVIDKY